LDFISSQLKWSQSRIITTTKAGKDEVKQEPLYTAGGNASEYNHYGKQNGDSSKN
jgi:hypothetical protein